MRKNTWHNAPGHYREELDDEPLGVLMPFAKEGDTLCIEFISSGYHDPGVSSGPVENCYPPEGEDERELDDVWLEREGVRINLPTEIHPKVFESYKSGVEQCAIDCDQD